MAVACMRWQPGRVQTWRRAEDGGFDGRRYEVAAIGERQARAYVGARHYSGTWVAARLRYGLMDVSGREPRLAGVAVLPVPVSKRAVLKVFPDLVPYRESLDLGRLVLEDEVPSNGEHGSLPGCSGSPMPPGSGGSCRSPTPCRGHVPTARS